MEPPRCSCLQFSGNRCAARSSNRLRRVPACRSAFRKGVVARRQTRRAVDADAQPDPPAAPAPRNADGRAIFWTPGKKGVWLPGGGGGATVESAGIPFQPWAKAVYADRLENQLEPHTRCKPSGGVRQFLTPYGVEMVELPELQRVFIFDIGGPHTYRTIYMDGRSHPADFTPAFYGHSIGWWEGDTLKRRDHGLQRGLLDRSARTPDDREAADARDVHAHGLVDDRVRIDD